MEKKSKIERLKTQMSKIYGERLDFDHWEELEYSVIDEIGLKLNEVIDRLNEQPEEITHGLDKWRWGIGERPSRLEVEDTTREWGEKEGWLPYKRNLREWFLYKIIEWYGYKLYYGDNTDILFLVKDNK